MQSLYMRQPNCSNGLTYLKISIVRLYAVHATHNFYSIERCFSNTAFITISFPSSLTQTCPLQETIFLPTFIQEHPLTLQYHELPSSLIRQASFVTRVTMKFTWSETLTKFYDLQMASYFSSSNRCLINSSRHSRIKEIEAL